MAMIAMAMPIAKDKMDAWRRFIAELQGPRHAEFVASRKSLGVRERTFHQSTPVGDFVIVTLEGANPETAFAKFGQDNSSFAQWFRREVKEIHGLDLSQPPPGPPPTIMVDTGA